MRLSCGFVPVFEVEGGFSRADAQIILSADAQTILSFYGSFVSLLGII